MPVLTLPNAPAVAEKLSNRALAKVVRFRVPAWSVLALVVLAVAVGFVVGRQRPAHHYVSYFGYPMVLDTTTGKACYAVAPKPTDPNALQDAAYTQDGTAVDPEMPNGQTVPLCSQE